MRNILSTIVLLLAIVISSIAQDEKHPLFNDGNFSGIKLRSIGPAFMSGRIADIAIHPNDDNLWYVAVGSGGVWKTKNAGVTWKPIFDSQPSYSIGCVTIDPNNPSIVWVGTGENVGGRHVGYGDGIYRSKDGGGTWINLGLKNSEHISKIIVHPENSDVVWVAAQGPLWNKGGDRGLYKTTDGGKTWEKTLGDDEWVGVTDMAIDPRNPDHLYAATWQRHRTVAAYMGGGPGTGLHRSTDGGETWEKLSSGLPKSDMGKIGLAISPMQPDVLYAAIELDRRSGGVYRSTDRGSTWEKRSNAVAGATGPHYYQELYASPHAFDRLYLVDVRMQVSDDGGKTFRRMKEESKHSDNHALAFRADDPDYLLVGTDGGMYESFDLAENWRYFGNLPLTQFYKVAVDDAEPFYNIYGGTQDNSTPRGPVRTDNITGIQNSDWRIILNWDGHQPATEPGNPNIVYAQRQQGRLSRVDIATGEVTDIQPQPGTDEGYERYNWDAPIFISPHSPTRVYFASYRLWRSDNRGDKWTAISPDLTRNQERMELPIMGKSQSWDAPWDYLAMSNYNTITSIAESPKQEGLIYIGTDDGLLQITEDGGQNWNKTEVGALPSVPETAYVNDIKADLFDANTVYMALDNHKYGDFKPYLLKSTNRGKSWTSIASNLPEKHLVWRIVQDHVTANLMFAATEFGVFFTVNGGNEWVQFKGGVPTISFRDLAIQRRENDLVCASFGRSYYLLDDYSFLREVSEQQMQQEATLFNTRKAWWYFPRPNLSFGPGKGSQGASHYVAPNPPFGAVFTYHLKDSLLSKKEMRQKKEKALKEQNANIPFPGWEAIESEFIDDGPKIWLLVTNSDGDPVRRVKGSVGKGIHRIAWDLRYPSPNAINPNSSGSGSFEPAGLMAAPGTYSVALYKEVDGEVTRLTEPRSFEVVPLHQPSIKGADMEAVNEFWRTYEKVTRSVSATNRALQNAINKSKAMHIALKRSSSAVGELDTRLNALHRDLQQLDARMNGSIAKRGPGERSAPNVSSRMFSVFLGVGQSSHGPTATNKQDLDIINSEMADISKTLEAKQKEMTSLANEMVRAGAPWIE
ncbi:MAG: glycosyl hydrolase [Bacteroidota bacterium]